MKVEEKLSAEIITYQSIHEFYEYICNTPINESFRWATLQSTNASYNFTDTKNFDEACELLKNGWNDMASKLTQKLKVKEKEVAPMMRPRTSLSVVGYQPVVPLYLNGVPTNMVNKKMVPVKQKVITLTKVVNYMSITSKEKIVEESIKALQIIKKLESQGYRINLNILSASSAGSQTVLCKIRIKNANEKLNINKLAFPLVHPSMQRRLSFRWKETYPTICSDFVYSYGTPLSDREIRRLLDENEYLLPRFIKKDVNNIKGIEDLENI